jgi:V8-like Glu-specific endopeptidase
MMNVSGHVQDDTVDWYIDLSNLEIHPGNSGGPIWYYDDDGQPSVVGVVSTGTGSDHANHRGVAGHDIAPHYNMLRDWIADNDSAIA